MKSDSYILTPYFLDEASPGLSTVARSGWHLIESSPTGPAKLDGPAKLGLAKKQQRMIELYRPLRDLVAQAVSEGRRPVSIAGDCCTSIGVLAGLQQAGLDPTLIWLDAHGDFNTWETTPSGFLGGMPLAMLVGRGEQTLVEGVGLQPFPEDQVILTDARDLDPGERKALESSAVNHLPDVNALLEKPLPDGPLYVHFDSDIVNPIAAPAMSYLAPGGPSAELMGRIFRRLAQSDQVAAVSLSAWNPQLDNDGQTREVIMALVGELVD